MLSFRKTIFYLGFGHSLVFANPYYRQTVLEPPHATKSIAVVGAGSAGLAVLKTLLDLPLEVRDGWEIVLYEQRRDVGGIWLPDPSEPQPPSLPETPLYPDLRTNTPHPTMTYPGFPFRPYSPLYPNHVFVQQYHADYAEHYNLTQYIRLNTSVATASWIGNSDYGKWNLTVREINGQARTNMFFDHLIAANGHNHYPYIPDWPGQTAWLKGNGIDDGEASRLTRDREILHSIFWRNGTKYSGKTVLVVGGGASGRDAALHVAPVAKKVYFSLKDDKTYPRRLPVHVELKPAVSHFNTTCVVFADNSSISDIDSVILATGYELRIPFLTHGGELVIDNNIDSRYAIEDTDVLTTNLRYLFPLHEHIFSLASSYPTTALAFVGLPILVANCPSDIAQALLVAHAIANSSILPSRDEMLEQLYEREDKMRQAGLDPYRVGHRLLDYDTPKDGSVPDMAHDYQDELVEFLKKRGALPDDGKPFVEPWRREIRNDSELLWNAWARVEKLGAREERRWLEGVESEDEWTDLMHRLVHWERDQEHEDL